MQQLATWEHAHLRVLAHSYRRENYELTSDQQTAHTLRRTLHLNALVRAIYLRDIEVRMDKV